MYFQPKGLIILEYHNYITDVQLVQSDQLKNNLLFVLINRLLNLVL